jgi:N6-adenosine-specific RNA methylase IME4
MSTALVTVDALTRELAEAADIPDIKRVRDKAEALRVLAKKIGAGLECQNHYALLKIDAEAKAGQVLIDMAESGQRRMPRTARSKDMMSLENLEIELHESKRWQRVANVGEVARRAYRDHCLSESEEVTSAGLIRFAGRLNHEDADPPAPLTGTYRAIVIDPPWPVAKIEREARPNQTKRLDYPTLTVEELKADLYKPPTAEDGAHVYLWTTHKFIPASFELFEHWGVKYECMLTWVKPTGMTPYSWMYNTEHVLFGRVGNLKVQELGIKLSFEAPVTRHSAKPDVFYDMVRRASPGPRADMFARIEHEGFEAWGNELPDRQAVE